MADQGWDELFAEGWREPGDDCERAVFYIIVAVEVTMGLAMLGWGLWTLFTAGEQSVRLLSLLGAVVGGTIAGLGGWFFAKESKHWDLRHLTADRIVAGGFLFGCALMLLGFQIGTHTGRAGEHAPHHSVREFEGSLAVAGWLVGAGAFDVTLFLIVGLLFAYAPQMRIRKRVAGVRIERRYAVDEKLNEIDDHPCPRADGLQPVVVLRLRDGRTRPMVCNESTYEMVRVGRQGTAVMRGKRLERFL